MVPMVIGFLGRSRAGKDTAADQMINKATFRYFLTARKYSISDLVLDFCNRSGRLPNKKREDLAEHELATLVHVGKQMRDKDELFWIRKIEAQILEDGAEVAFIPNVRFPTEVNLVKKYGGKLVRVTAVTEYGTEFIGPDRDPNDVSEVGIAYVPADYYITAQRGQDRLVRAMATDVFDEIVSEMRGG